jgi:alpha-L-fucosidase
MKRSSTMGLCLLALSACKSGGGGNLAALPPGQSAGPVQELADMDWWRQSQDTLDQRIGWFREARFGMFVHWGVYSTLGGVWEGQPVKGYAEHIQRIKKIPGPVYREKVVTQFNPTEFNADEWIATAKRAGMGYFIITAKHHDGFAMYDSGVTDFNVVKATPWKRDPMRELKDACKKHGVHFGFYYSHAYDWDAAGGGGEGWGYKRSQGERTLEEDNKFFQDNPTAAAKARQYVDSKAIPQIRELIAKYDPEIMWFDTPSHLPLAENLRILKAAREAKPGLLVSGRITQGAPGGPKARFGDYLSTTDKPAEFPPNDGEWEAIPTTNESYGWHKMDDTHKPPEHFIQLLAKAAARGGNVLLNIGPMGTGKFDPKDVKILDGVAAWFKSNGESIRGSSRTMLPVQAWGESTRRGNTLYLHVLSWPRKGHIVVGGLKSKVKQAYLLADAKKAPLEVERAGELDVIVQGPATAPDAADTVIALELEGDPSVDRARLLSTEVAVDTLRAFDGMLGGNLSYGTGKSRDAYVLGWTKPDDAVSWLTRVREPATFDVGISYDADAKSAGNTFTVKLGTKSLTGTVAPTPAAPVSLGKISLEPGKMEIAVEPGKIAAGTELLRLRALTLTPVLPAAEAEKKPEKPTKGKRRPK